MSFLSTPHTFPLYNVVILILLTLEFMTVSYGCFNACSFSHLSQAERLSSA